MATDVPGLWLGTAKVVITPPVGGELSGFVARTAPMAGVHDELHARALVWAEDAALAGAAALVTLDVLDLDAATVAAIRAWATAQTGIPGERIGVACTHTHGGPATLAWGGLGRADEAYLALLPRLAGGAIAQAARRLEPVSLRYACGHEPTVGSNRRVPGGVADPAVPVVRFRRPDGTVAALLVGHACHPVTLGPDNLLATADYPGYALRTLEAIYPGALAVFATGCCGQINPGHTALDGVRGHGADRRTYAEAARLGRLLTAAAVAAVERADAAGDPSAPGRPAAGPLAVRAARRVVALPLLPAPPDDELARLARAWRDERAQLARAGGPAGGIARCDIWLAWAAALRAGRLPAAIEAEVLTIALGAVTLVLLPGEQFVEHGLAIKARADRPPVVPIGYANGTPGYIPHRSAYPEGGYEVVEAHRYYGNPACFAPEAGEAVVAAALDLLAR